MSALLQRTLTGALFAAVVLGCIYGGRWSFLGLVCAINFLCLYEYVSLFRERNFNPSVPLLLACSLGLMGIFVVWLSGMGYWGRVPALAGPLLLLPLAGELFRQKPDPFIRGIIGMGGLIYVTGAMLLYALFAFTFDGYEPHVAASVFYLVWASDTFAYLVGKAIGRTPLFPSVSPKKTLEGSLGGAAGAIGVSVLLFYTIGFLSLPAWIGLAVVIVFFGALGDLIESMLKRSLGLKDSGNILPGHGGVLDRFDAFLFALPFATAYLYLVR